WDNPPTLDNLKGHAGCLPNCRCYPEPSIPDI
ncbi:phage head morphogenesis protein, partial [Acinetobacter sp. 11520]|nr:phage head morphogenesis protein [Acinetobacter sp. 11520]